MMSGGRSGHARKPAPASSLKRPVAMHRLLDDEDAAPQLAQGRFERRLLPELAERFEVVEVLVAVERDEEVSAGFALEQATRAPAGAGSRAPRRR